MADYVFSPPAVTSLAVTGSPARFPIRRVFCVGRNYAAHAREMGGDPNREPPFFFMKPANAVVPAEGVVPYPPMTQNLHHEMELVVAIGGNGGGNGQAVSPQEALQLVWGYAAGVDMTRRDLQDQAKEARRPWEWSKSFDASGPCSPLVPVAQCGHPGTGRIWLSVNGQMKQDADLQELVWPVADVISHISQAMALAPGDLIFTGTPAGVGPLQPGDRVQGGVAGVGEFTFTVGPRP